MANIARGSSRMFLSAPTRRDLSHPPAVVNRHANIILKLGGKNRRFTSVAFV